MGLNPKPSDFPNSPSPVRFQRPLSREAVEGMFIRFAHARSTYQRDLQYERSE
jgi:hypothetical protein